MTSFFGFERSEGRYLCTSDGIINCIAQLIAQWRQDISNGFKLMDFIEYTEKRIKFHILLTFITFIRKRKLKIGAIGRM